MTHSEDNFTATPAAAALYEYYSARADREWREGSPGYVRESDECVGACGRPVCRRDDCRSCESCGAYFDAGDEGSCCGTLGPYCGECGPMRCRDGVCCGDPDRYRD